MLRTLLALVLMVSGSIAIASEVAPSAALPAGSGPWVVRAHFKNRAQLDQLTQRSAPWEVRRDQGYAVVEVADRADYARLLAEGFMLSPDSSLSAVLRGADTRSLPGFACYRTVEETGASMGALASAHPTLASVVDIGDSWDKLHHAGAGYDLKVLRLTNSAVAGPKPRMVVIGAIHAREYATAETVIRFGESLLARYATDADVRFLLDQHEVYLLPHANPDGRKKAELGPLWRKNVNEAYCGASSSSRGADLNRNFPFEWGAHNGSSDQPCNDVYRGTGAASEPETDALVTYVRTLFPDARPPGLYAPAPDTTPGVFVDLHSYGSLVMWPWGFSESPAPNATALTTLGRRLAWFNGYTPEPSVALYTTDGTTQDFTYGELGVASFSFELGTAFFERCENFEQTVLPTNLRALEYLLRVARRPYQDPAGPALGRVLSSPVEADEPIRVVARADDSGFNQSFGVEPVQTIAGVNGHYDRLPWSAGAGPGVAATALDGVFGSAAEIVALQFPSPGPALGAHTVYLRARDGAASGPLFAHQVDVVAHGTTARLLGAIRDASSGLPLTRPALLTLGNYGTASDPTGRSQYSLRAPPGSYSLTVEAEGYASSTLPNLNLQAPEERQLDVVLDPLCTLLEDTGTDLNQFTAEPPWGPASNRYISAPSSFSDSPVGDYPNNANLALTSAPLDLRDSHGLSLSFQSFCDTEAGWDFGRVEISTDGSQWTQVWACNAKALWESVSLPLPELEGAGVARIRFRLTSDPSVTRDGWSIDEIRLRAAGPVCGSIDILYANGFE